MAYKQLDESLMNLLTGMALQAQQARLQDAATEKRQEHEMNLQLLNIKTNQMFKLEDSLSSKRAEFENVANENEVSRIAFDALDEKHKGIDNAASLVTSQNQTNLEILDQEIGSLREQIRKVDTDKRILNDTIKDVSDAKVLFEEQAFLLGTGADDAFQSVDLEGLSSTLPTTADGDFITSQGYEEALEGGVSPEELELFDVDSSGKLDDKDRKLIENITSMLDIKSGMEGVDADKLFDDTMERMKTTEILNDLNSSIIGGQNVNRMSLEQINNIITETKAQKVAKHSEIMGILKLMNKLNQNLKV